MASASRDARGSGRGGAVSRERDPRHRAGVHEPDEGDHDTEDRELRDDVRRTHRRHGRRGDDVMHRHPDGDDEHRRAALRATPAGALGSVPGFGVRRAVATATMTVAPARIIRTGDQQTRLWKSDSAAISMSFIASPPRRRGSTLERRTTNRAADSGLVRATLGLMTRVSLALVLALAAGCGGGSNAHPMLDGGPGSDAGPGSTFGATHDGQYNLGPVDWSESTWHNACSPYPAEIQSIEGDLLAGVSNGAGTGETCDACIRITTAMGRSLVARVVTYGDTMGPGDVDLSPQAYDMLNAGEYPRTMSWQLVTCPTTSPLYVQYQTGANVWWTSFWIRNPRVAIDHVSVTSANHTTPVDLVQGGDGTFTDGGGFGDGPFTLTVVGADGSTFSQTFASFTPGALVMASGNL